MRCGTTSCKWETHSWTKIAPPLIHVRRRPPALDLSWLTIISLGIKRTKLRLVRYRARMAMNAQDHLNDARADYNLVDVAPIPAPWDVKPADAS
jgi:hypothetical protein